MTTPPWQTRFELKTCTTAKMTTAIPAKAIGVAVIYAETETGETIYLVLESRAGSLRDFCVKRLATAKIPADTALKVAFKTMPLADSTPESLSAACREQVLIAGALRRELRPAMR
jgi:hypothetical protein